MTLSTPRTPSEPDPYGGVAYDDIPAIARELARLAYRLREALPTPATTESMEARTQAAQAGWAAPAGHHYALQDVEKAYRRAVNDAAEFVLGRAAVLSREFDDIKRMDLPPKLHVITRTLQQMRAWALLSNINPDHCRLVYHTQHIRGIERIAVVSIDNPASFSAQVIFQREGLYRELQAKGENTIWLAENDRRLLYYRRR